MDVDRFSKSPVGDLRPIRVQEGDDWVDHFCFVPHPLPEYPVLAPQTWGAAMDASRQIGRVDALANERLPSPILISRPTIRREAVSTSALEGTYAPAAEVLSSELDDDQPKSVAVREVLNFVRATEYATAVLEDLPISMRLICELQKMLVTGTPSEDWQSGQIRQTPVLIGPYQGAGILESFFVPPTDHDTLVQGLSDWEKWIHADTSLHPLIRVALGHYQFEALHPFTDGNGRIGRLVAILQLIAYGLLKEPIINLSPFFEARDETYRELLREVSATGSFDEWIQFSCVALSTQAQAAEARILRLLDWREGTRAALRDRKIRGVALAIAEQLIQYPTVTVSMLASVNGVTFPAANSAVSKLEEMGILEEMTGRDHHRVFEARDVFRILFED